MHKLANILFTTQELDSATEQGKHFLVKGKSIYQIDYCIPSRLYYARKIYTSQRPSPFTKRGRFFLMTAKAVNSLIGFEYFC